MEVFIVSTVFVLLFKINYALIDHFWEKKRSISYLIPVIETLICVAALAYVFLPEAEISDMYFFICLILLMQAFGSIMTATLIMRVEHKERQSRKERAKLSRLSNNAIYQEFHHMAEQAVKEFAKTKKNQKVYAIVIEGEKKSGWICIKYANEQQFYRRLEKEKRGKEALSAQDVQNIKYQTDFFEAVSYVEESEAVMHFIDSYRHYYTGEAYEGSGVPRSKSNASPLIWETMIKRCAESIEKEDWGLNKTADFKVWFEIK